MSDDDEPAVEVADLTVCFGDQTALDRVSLTVAPHSTVAVIGPSGSGKSTLLRAIAGLEPPTAGRVSIHGIDRTSAAPHDRRVGLMFQDHALFPHLDVASNVAFGMKMNRVSSAAIRQRTVDVLELVGMAEFGDRAIETLSGGEAQRVALARALAPSPEVLMLDEPLGSLDRSMREELIGELRQLFHRLGLAVIHVTHDQREAFALADRVMVLRDGAAAQTGSPSEIWRRPRSAWVAAFVGHPNLWPADDGVVLAPINSLAVVEPADRRPAGPAVDVTVVDVEFREGRYRLTAVERSPAADGGRRFVVDAATEFVIGQHAAVVIDHSALVTLPN